MNEDEIHVERLEGCARCAGEGHDDLTFRRLTNPVLEGDVVVATHWTPCPTNGEPILLVQRERQTD